MRRIKFLRIDRGLSLKKLGALASIHHSQICLIERVRLIPSDVQLAKLATALNCDPARLLDHVTAAPLGDGAEARDAQREGHRG